MMFGDEAALRLKFTRGIKTRNILPPLVPDMSLSQWTSQPFKMAAVNGLSNTTLSCRNRFFYFAFFQKDQTSFELFRPVSKAEASPQSHADWKYQAQCADSWKK